MPGGKVILIAEDSEAGQSHWQALEEPLRREMAGTELSCITRENANDLLAMLARLKLQQRPSPDLIVLDLHLPHNADFASARAQGGNIVRAGVWLALAIRISGNDTSKIALWTSNVVANELNEGFAFLQLKVNGERVGDEVIDKSEDLASQVNKIRQLLQSEKRQEPIWEPPPPTVSLTKVQMQTLPYLEAALRPSRVVEVEYMETSGWKSRIDGLRGRLCDGYDTRSTYELKPLIVAKAREARIPWVPLNYLQVSQNPYLNGTIPEDVKIST